MPFYNLATGDFCCKHLIYRVNTPSFAKGDNESADIMFDNQVLYLPVVPENLAGLIIRLRIVGTRFTDETDKPKTETLPGLDLVGNQPGNLSFPHNENVFTGSKPCKVIIECYPPK